MPASKNKEEYVTPQPPVREEEPSTSSNRVETSNYTYLSTFTGHISGYIGVAIVSWIIIVFTLGLGYPWAICLTQNWYVKNTVIDGKRLTFDGNGWQLFGNYIKWIFLTIFTFGIYGLWLPIKLQQWLVKHTHVA